MDAAQFEAELDDLAVKLLDLLTRADASKLSEAEMEAAAQRVMDRREVAFKTLLADA